MAFSLQGPSKLLNSIVRYKYYDGHMYVMTFEFLRVTPVRDCLVLTNARTVIDELLKR